MEPSPSVLFVSAIRNLLVERIDVHHQSVGIVVGVVHPEGRDVIAYGHLAKGDPRQLNGDTIFEIGSATKVFTSLLLTEMVRRGEVALDDPISKYLPAAALAPLLKAPSITLLELATHTSGLPRLPLNLSLRNRSNPYADYSVAQLYQALKFHQIRSVFRPKRAAGSRYEYSNLGGGLLGHVLALRAATSYEELVRSRICDLLAMTDTSITLDSDRKERLATGHNSAIKPTANWDLPTLAGAGALRSTANDLLTFLAANLGFTQSPLSSPMAAMLKDRRSRGQPGREVALGWHVDTTEGGEMIWHNGGTGGYRSFIGFVPNRKIGVVALSNAETTAGVDDIARHLLDPSIPLLKLSQNK